jgi:hypothetical protein
LGRKLITCFCDVNNFAKIFSRRCVRGRHRAARRRHAPVTEKFAAKYRDAKKTPENTARGNLRGDAAARSRTSQGRSATPFRMKFRAVADAPPAAEKFRSKARNAQNCANLASVRGDDRGTPCAISGRPKSGRPREAAGQANDGEGAQWPSSSSNSA